MLNIRKRFFLLLTIVGVLLGFTACVSSKDTVRVSFDKPEYTVKVGQVLDITPIIEKGSNVEKVTIEYSSTNPDVATYVDGKLTGLQAGEAEIRIVCSEKPVAFDVATVKVVENEIPDVQFVEPQKSMIKGTTQTLQYKFVPEYASANMTFESANPDIATVDENGVISAVKAGKATIIARAIDVNDATQHKDYVFTIEVIEADFAINYVLNDGVNNPDNPAGYNILTLPLEILAPTKEAYRFLGWYDNAEFNGDPITEIAAGTTGDVTLYAKWELVIYSIVYELNGGTNAETNPDTYNIENLPLTLANPTKAGYTFLGWYNGETKVTEVPAGTTGEFKVEAKWQINEYTISYDLAEGAWEDTAGVGSYTIESEDIVLPNPVRNGYKFLGWYNVDEKVETITKGSTGNLELVAKWEIEKYSINYELNGGAFDSVAEISKDAKHTFTISDYLTFAAATGYKNALVNKAGGRWWAYVVLQKTAVPGLYKVVQMANGSTKITEQYDMLITWHSALKDTAAKTILNGMLNNSGAYVGSYIKVSNVPAEKTADCNITAEVFDKDAIEIKDSSVKSYTIEDEVTLATPTKEGQVFLGWYNGENKVETIAKGSTGEVTVTAKWYNPNAELTLNCELNGGTLPEGAVIKFISKDGLATLPTPEKVGYTFKGWYADSECTQLVTSIEAGLSENPTVYAAWQINTYKITYETNGGEFQVDKTVPLYDSFEDLVAAFLSDYASFYNISGLTAASFFGKTNQYGPYGFFKNAEMNAKWGWLAEYILTVAKSTNYVGKANLVMGAGAANYNKYMRSNLAAFLQKAKLTNVTPVPMNFVNADCDALWAACPTKEIKVGIAAKYEYTVEELPLELPTPTKDGFKFLGWYGNAECTGDAITSISADATEDVNLWALWLDLSKSYNITYVLNGGNSLYADRAALVADLLNDLNTTCGKSITASKFTSNCRKPEFTKFITDDTMWAKWKWLFQYLADTDKHEKAADVYKGVLENRTVSDDFWFLTRDFAGFVNKTVGNFYYSVNAIDFTTFAAGDGFWNLIQTEINDPKAVELLTPNYPYYEFEGWYDNPEFTGERVLVPSKDGKLYAKWSKKMATLTYSIGDVDATVTNETVKVHASDSFVLETPTYDPKYLRFNGWYKEAECINPITEISEYTTQDITVYASWTEIDGYTINYVLNGGSLIYQDRDAVIADFIKDYNEAIGTSYASAADIPTGNFADINYHTFYTKVLSDGTVIRDKWLWLAQYLLRLSQRDLAGNNCNVLGLSALVNNKAYSGDAIYGISYAFRSFLKGTTLRPGSSYTSVDYTVYENAHGFWNDLSAAENGEYLNNKGTVTLPTAYLENYKFAGWFTNAECTGEPVTTVSDTATLYAKYVEATPVESVTITNKITEIKRYETYQLQWQVLPTNANIQAVKFESSDTRIATVDVNGLVTAVSEGDVEIKVISLSPSGKSDSLKLNVYAPDHFKISYETVSYVKVGGSIKLNASYIKRDGSASELEWSSVTPEIATVDENGKVTAVKEGLATIRVSAKGNADIKQDFVVTVLPATLSKELQEVVDAHESNAFIRWDLGIGAGGPAYYRDIYGSVSKVLYNDALVIDTKHKATQDGISTNHGAEMSAIDFITVHYTGNMSPKADANANASYFAGGGGGTSIHYVTGNDGVFYCLDEKYGGYHAGDSSMGERKWIKTGIKATSDDPETPVWGISSNSKFTLNGQETIVNVPEGTTDATKKVTGNTFVYNGKVQNCINDMGLAWKIADGEYYMLDTWWCYSQVSAGRICNYGGNRNSIGIESAVNPESDLWYTWQRTAQLVANIMVRHNLDITRVVGHHFWTAKDCPQPLLENNLEIWDIFIESVKHEYKLITDFKDTKFAFTCDSDIIGKNGRVATQPLFSQIVTYTVEVNGEKITLATMVEGRYNKK